jgi:galactonate dehydratase
MLPTTRRAFLAACGTAAGAALAPRWLDAAPALRLTGFELLPVRASERTVWLIVRLRTDAGLTGLGEASDAFGFANTTREDAARMEAELRGLFELVKGRSPLDVESYRQRALPLASKGLVQATAFSAIEQALWDLAARRSTCRPRRCSAARSATGWPCTPTSIAPPTRARPTASPRRRAPPVRDGFRSLKAAPWDGFPPAGSPPARVEAAVQAGIQATRAMRDAVGSGVEIMVDCHSFFDVDLAARVAKELEPVKLAWYEEPVAPERLEETLAIRKRIVQPMAGGEVLFGVAGFAGLTRTRAVNVIMPDVKHCGGLLELTRIAAMADADGVAVAPHNPSGPVSTAATVQVCAGLRNFRLLEFQWGKPRGGATCSNRPNSSSTGRLPCRRGPGSAWSSTTASSTPTR